MVSLVLLLSLAAYAVNRITLAILKLWFKSYPGYPFDRMLLLLVLLVMWATTYLVGASSDLWAGVGLFGPPLVLVASSGASLLLVRVDSYLSVRTDASMLGMFNKQ